MRYDGSPTHPPNPKLPPSIHPPTYSVDTRYT